MPQGQQTDRVELAHETELQRCLRIYKNDSLIAWHLGIPKDQVTAARERYKPPRMRGGWISGGELNCEEFERRKKDAAIFNRDYLAAVQRVHGNG